MTLPAGSDYLLCTVANPDFAVSDPHLYIVVDSSSTDFWTAADSTDGTRCRAAKADGTELAFHALVWDTTADLAVFRVSWSGTLAGSGTQQIRLYPALTTNTAYAATDTFGRHAVYRSGVQVYFNFEDDLTTDGTGNNSDVDVDTGTIAFQTDTQFAKVRNYANAAYSEFDTPSIAANSPLCVMGWGTPDTAASTTYAGTRTTSEIVMRRDGGNLEWIVNSLGTPDRISGSTTITTGTRYHFAGIYRGAKGTASGATTDAAGYSIGDTVITLASAGTGTIVVGDHITFAGDAVRYPIASGDADVSNGGTITLVAPGLKSAIAASTTAITVLGNLSCYVDGDPDGTTTSGDNTYPSVSAWNLANFQAPSTSRDWEGDIAHFFIFDEAPIEAEVKLEYDMTTDSATFWGTLVWQGGAGSSLVADSISRAYSVSSIDFTQSFSVDAVTRSRAISDVIFSQSISAESVNRSRPLSDIGFNVGFALDAIARTRSAQDIGSSQSTPIDAVSRSRSIQDLTISQVFGFDALGRARSIFDVEFTSDLALVVDPILRARTLADIIVIGSFGVDSVSRSRSVQNVGFSQSLPFDLLARSRALSDLAISQDFTIDAVSRSHTIADIDLISALSITIESISRMRTINDVGVTISGESLGAANLVVVSGSNRLVTIAGQNRLVGA